MKKFCIGTVIFIAFGTAAIATASDVGAYYWVLKKADFDQRSVAAPTPSQLPFQFASAVERSSTGTLLSTSTFTPPSGVNLFYGVVEGGLAYDGFFPAQADLDNTFATGNYELDLHGTQTDYSATLILDGTTYPAEIPKLSNTNFVVGQLLVDATAAFTLTWNSFADAGPLDEILLTVYDSSTPLLRSVLPATATSQAFAANFLTPDQTYLVELNFIKISHKDFTSIPGSTGLTGLANSTHITLSTSTGTPASGLGNISTRGLVGTDANALISGFIVTNTDQTSTLQVVVRAIGPSLSKMGVLDALQDTVLYLNDVNGNLIAADDDWASAATANEVEAAGLAPTDARESALWAELAPGQYTAIVLGKNGTTGVGLAEVYNLGSDGDSKLANISTRGQVKTGDQVMIGGLIIIGVSQNVIVRALGPSLTGEGVPGALADPSLQLFNAQGSVLASNNNWKDTQEAAIEATGIPPTNDLESAVVETLGPGNYTAIVRGFGGISGVGLVEAYALPP